MKKFITILTVLLSNLANATTNEINRLDWHLKKEIGDIQVLSAQVPDSAYLAYLAITVVDTTTDELVKIIRNPATCSEWVYRCGQSYRYDQESPNIDLVYTATNMPFPVRDRDTLARITWDEDPDTNVVTAVGIATSDVLAPKKKHIRIENAKVIWEFTPLDDGTTQVKTYGHADPGGELPAWLINQMSTDVPVKTLNGLKKLVAAKQSEAVETVDYRVANNTHWDHHNR